MCWGPDSGSPAGTVSTFDLSIIPSAPGMLSKRGLYSLWSLQDVQSMCLLLSFLLAADFFKKLYCLFLSAVNC